MRFEMDAPMPSPFCSSDTTGWSLLLFNGFCVTVLRRRISLKKFSWKSTEKPGSTTHAKAVSKCGYCNIHIIEVLTGESTLHGEASTALHKSRDDDNLS